MGNIYITSDTHFNHGKTFLYEPRGFQTIDDHDKQIIENWNSVVNNDDIVYHLGDFAMGEAEDVRYFMEQLHGEIHIIRGNHDTDRKWAMYGQYYEVFPEGYGMMLKYRKYHFYLSHYPTLTSNMDYDKPLRNRVINLCGHSHSQDRWCDWDKGFIYHCELDAHDNKLVLLDDIIEEIKEKVCVL